MWEMFLSWDKCQSGAAHTVHVVHSVGYSLFNKCIVKTDM